MPKKVTFQVTFLVICHFFPSVFLKNVYFSLAQEK